MCTSDVFVLYMFARCFFYFFLQFYFFFSGQKCLQNVTTLTIYWFYNVFVGCVCVPWICAFSGVFISALTLKPPELIRFVQQRRTFTHKHSLGHGLGSAQKRKRQNKKKKRKREKKNGEKKENKTTRKSVSRALSTFLSFFDLFSSSHR